MKEKILKKGIIILLLIIQILQLGGNFLYSNAAIKEGDVVHLQGDHECDSLLEYWMEDYQKWSYKVVWYVYYIDKETQNKYPAFCIEPAKEGVGTGYDSYDVTIKNEKDNRIWRVLNKGYMGSIYKDWNLECDDDLYSATKVALHAIAEGKAPKDKYILGTRSVDGNTVEEIQRRGKKVLEVAQILYEYGLHGKETYVSPKVSISKQGENKIETINNTSYYIQNYKVTGNKTLKSYEVEIENFPSGTKILNSKNQEQVKLSESSFKIAIPVNEIKQDVKGNIKIKDAYIKTNPIFYCKSSIEEAQSYVTYMAGYETASTSTTLEIKANTSNLKIQKIDKETKKPIADVTFEILNEKRNKIAEVTTNKDGIAELNNIYPQTVIVKEIKVPEQYVLSNEEKQVKLEWKKTASVTFENVRKKGNLKIVKVDADNNEIKLENVEFELYDNKVNLVKKLITDKNGEAYIKDLEIGTYILKETKTKDGYNIASDRKLEIKWNETKVEKIENKKQKGQIEVYKVDKENKQQKLEGVIFEVLDKDEKRIETIITDKDGYSITSKLPVGIYYLKEIKTNNKYILNKELIKVEVKNDQITTIRVENQKKKGKIEVYKVDSENKKQKIEGVTFEVLNENKQVVEKITTNKNGYAITNKLDIGTYYLKEIATEDEYILSEELIKVEVKNEQITTVNVENQKKKGQIEIYKVDKENNEIKLENVEFEVLDENNKLIEKLITNKEGYAITKELPIGKYYIKEIKTDEKYVLNEERINVEVKYNEIETLKIENEKIKGQIEILKISEDDNLINGNKKGSPIENVEFEIRKENGEVVEKITTNKEGIATSSKLEKGEYIIKEIKSHKDYIITNEEFKIQIIEYNKIEQITITNKSKDPELPKLPRTGF